MLPAQLIPISLALIMFSMGLSLQTQDFQRLLQRPKPAFIGLCGQIILLPLTAWLVAHLLGLNSILSAGLVLLALCPGGVTSNLATLLARGDAALSVSLTASSSIITVFTLPLVMNLILHAAPQAEASFSLPLLPAVQQLAILTLFPLLLGMLLRHFAKPFVIAHQAKMTLLSAVLFVIIISSVWVQQWDNIRYSAAQTGTAVIGLNLLSLLIGWSIARLNRMPLAGQVTLSLEVGLQNSALAVVVAMNLIGNPQLAIPASVYSVVMICSAVSVIIIGRRLYTPSVASTSTKQHTI